MRKRHQEIYSAQENFDRAAALQGFIEETNRHIGKAYLNGKPDEIYNQADSWMAYLWWVPTLDFEEVFEHCTRTRTNPSSALTLQNFQQAARDLINQNKIQPIRTDSIDPECPHCHGLGWAYLEVWLTPEGDEFATPELCRVVDRCECERYRHRKPDHTHLVRQMMRWLAAAHPHGIPNVEREQRAAEKIAALGYDFDDVQSFVGGDELLSLIPVVKGIGRWQFQRELRAVDLPATLPEIASIALRVINAGGVSEQQMEREKNARLQFAQQRQAVNQLCEQCGVRQESGRCENCDDLQI